MKEKIKKEETKKEKETINTANINETVNTNEIENVEFINSQAKESKNENKTKRSSKFFEYSFWRIFAYFVIYSMLGFIIETLFAFSTQGILESRKSMLIGPFCSIYGLGAICLICIPKKLKSRTIYLFIAGIIIGSVVEYLVSWGGECIYHIKWWDYSDLPFNLNGRICVFYSVFWGFLTVLLNRYINPRVDKYIIDKINKKFSKKVIHIFLICVMIFYIIDFLVSSFATKMFFARVIHNNNIENVKGANRYYERYLDIKDNHKTINWILDNIFTDEVMLKTFPNLKITLEDNSTILIKDILTDIQPYYVKVFTPPKFKDHNEEE